MNRDILAPPKVSVRSYAKGVIAVSLIITVAGIVLSYQDLSIGRLLFKCATVAATGVAAVLIYSYLFHLGRRCRPERMPFIHALIVPIALGVFFIDLAVFIPLFGGGGLWWQAPFMFGAALASGGWARRVGDSLHCPACEYEHTFDADDGPIRCPECGTAWLGRLKKGRRIKSGRMMGAGVIIALLSVVVFNPVFYMGYLGPHLPTPLLFASLYASPGSIFYCWDELGKRPLNAYWTGVMAERVLSYRAARQWDRAPGQWLEGAIVAGKLPGTLSERFYAEGFQAKLHVPRHVKVGEPFEAAFRVTQATEAMSVLGVIFGGYRVDEAPAVGLARDIAWPHELRPSTFSSHRDVHIRTLRAGHTGTVRVRVTYWVVYQPSFSNQFDWQPDGSPTMPANATWFQRRDLEQVIAVDP